MNIVATRRSLTNNFPALTHQNFRYFWSGQCLSLLGTWMQRTAQQWMVYEMTKSAFLLGLLGVFQFGPVLLLSLFAGVMVDRYPKKKILLLTQGLLMVQAIILALLVWTGLVQYWHILVLAAVMGLANTLDMPARQSFIIELVGKQDLMSGIALNSAIVHLARIIGPAIAGLIITFFSTATCFFLNGLSFVAVLVGLLFIKSSESLIRVKKTGIFGDVWEGLKYIASQQVLWTAVLAMLAIATFAMNTNVIIPVYARDVLQKQASGYSFLLSAMGVGSFIGALVMSGRSKTGPSNRILWGSAAIQCLFYMLLIMVQSYTISMTIIAIIGFLNVCFMTTVNSTLQLNSDDEHRGRAMGVFSLVFAGTTPLGNLLAGAIIERFGANAGFFACGAFALAFLALLWLGIRYKKSKAGEASS